MDQEYWDDAEMSDCFHDDTETDGELTPDDDTPVSDDSFYLAGATPPPSDEDDPHKISPLKKFPEEKLESGSPLLIKSLLPPSKKIKTPKNPLNPKTVLNRAQTALPRLRHPKTTVDVAKQQKKKIPQIETNLFQVRKKALGCRTPPNSFPRPFESEGKTRNSLQNKGESPKLRKKVSN